MERSPQSDNTSPEQETNKKPRNEILEAIKGVREDLLKEMKQSEARSVETLTNKMDALESSIGQKVLQLEDTVQKLEQEINGLKVNNSQLNDKLLQIDREQRKRNIKVTGIPAETYVEAKENLKKLFQKTLNREVKLENVRLINTAKGKKVLATCSTMDDKINIMKTKQSLKDEAGRPVYVDNDLSREDAQIFFKARTTGAQLRQEGHKVKVQTTRISVDGEWRYYCNETDDFVSQETFRKNAP